MRGFRYCHPVLNMAYFIAVIGLAMFFMQPVCLFISLFFAVFYFAYINGASSFLRQMRYIFPLMLFTAVLNPFFSHEGETVLFHIKEIPFTFESIFFGITAALMLASVIFWFSSYSHIMSSDKLMYVFGGIAPSFSLLVSITLRFVPLFKYRFKSVSNARSLTGYAPVSIRGKLKEGSRVMYSMLEWSLESAVVSGESMKSRGYGLKGRTSCQRHVFCKRDFYVFGFMIICVSFILWGIISGLVSFSFYPAISGDVISLKAVLFYVVYAALCALPLAIDFAEDIKWKYMVSKI
ncbi:MAG: energy-coupling factor transporter transmembrane component T [Lachnospiraceae bacterium]|nr:energy-coupling factor transporter transmembrane component T [Lachnospiraceae bacterium]